MSDEEEVLLEQYYINKGLNKNERDFYINLLLNSKELTESEFNYSSQSSSKYDLVFITLENKGHYVTFYGAISNGEENKIIDGSIIKRGNKFLVINNIYRLFELLSDDEKEYNVVDIFRFKNGQLKRNTKYADERVFDADIELKTQEEMIDYYRSKINPDKGRLLG